MAIGFPLSNDDFKEVMQGDYLYVDKTLMLQEILSDGTKSFLITCPRRFGKSLNMSMIKYFFDIREAEQNRKMFEDTLIASASYEVEGVNLSCMDEQGQYPVVLLSLKGLKAANTYDKMISLIRIVISKLYRKHDYLLESSKLSVVDKEMFQKIHFSKSTNEELSYSLLTLTELLHDHYDKPVMLLLDEYDTPLHTAYQAKEPFYEELIEFMGTFLGEAFKGNTNIKKGLMTGILRVSLMNLFSGVNNIIVRNVLDAKYARHFGFTDSEVLGLFQQLNRKQDEAKVKAWYNGYNFGSVTVYNPWSILNCLEQNDRFAAYWIGTAEHGVLGGALISCSDLEVFDQMQTLLEGKSIEMIMDERTVFATLHGSQAALWNLMLYSGYLTAIKSWEDEEDSETHVEVRLPNREVSLSIKRMVKDWIALSATKSINSELVACLTSGDAKRFGKVVQRYILETISFYDFNYNTEERFYHIFMLGMFVGFDNQFIVDSNKESGFGRYDIILIPKDKKMIGIVIELKRVEVMSQKQERELKADDAMREDLLEAEAFDALAQIEKRAYGVRFAQHDIKKYVAIGLAFLGKEVSVKDKVINS